MMKRAPDDDAAQLLDEPGDRFHGAAGGEHVVVDQDARAVPIRVGVQLERVLAVLEAVGRADRLGRQLPGPPGRDEAAADLARDRRAEDEPARLGAENEVRLPPRPHSASSDTVCWSARGLRAAG